MQFKFSSNLSSNLISDMIEFGLWVRVLPFQQYFQGHVWLKNLSFLLNILGCNRIVILRNEYFDNVEFYCFEEYELSDLFKCKLSNLVIMNDNNNNNSFSLGFLNFFLSGFFNIFYNLSTEII